MVLQDEIKNGESSVLEFKRELPTLAKQGGIRRSQNPFRNK